MYAQLFSSNPDHELLILADFIDWDTLESKLSQCFANEAGTPAKPVRLVVGIMLLQQMYKMSDEEAVYKWVENPYWQLFCGYDYLQWKFPIHPTTLTKWRQRLGSEGVERVFETIVKTAADCGMVQPKSFSKVIADTTGEYLWRESGGVLDRGALLHTDRHRAGDGNRDLWFLASALPVWLLLAPRDYLSTFVKLGVIFLLAHWHLLYAPAIAIAADHAIC